MATGAALANTCWFGGYDLGGDLRTMSMPISYDELDDTRYGMTGRSRLAGLESVSAAVSGYSQLGTGLVEETLHGFNGSTNQPISMSPDGLAGSVDWFWMAKQLAFTPLDGEVGTVAPFMMTAASARSAGGSSAVGAVHGRILKAKGSISATGATGSVVQVGAVASGKYLYAVCHTFAIGTSFTLQIQSDDNNGMSSPTTRGTIGSITATGGYWMTRVAGPITDDYWRVNVSAVTGTSTIAVAIGIK